MGWQAGSTPKAQKEPGLRKVKTKPRTKAGCTGISSPGTVSQKPPASQTPAQTRSKQNPPLAKVIQKPHKVKKKLCGPGRFFFAPCRGTFLHLLAWVGGGCEDTASAIRGKEIKLANASVVGLGRGGMIQLCLRVRMRCEPPPSGARVLCSHHFRVRVLFSA